MGAEEKIVTATTKLTEQVAEHNRTLSFLKLKLEPILNGWKENAENLVRNIEAIESNLSELVILATKYVEDETKRKEEEKHVGEPGPETEQPVQTGGDTTAGAPGPEKV